MTRVIVFGIFLAVMASGAAAQADLAKVNGQPILPQDLKNALSGYNEGQRESILRDMNTRRELLIGLIDQELLTQEAVKEKLDQDADFKSAMNMFRKQYLASRILQKNVGSKVNDSVAKKYYESHRSRFSTDQVHVQHILLPSEAAAAEMLIKAKAANADFQELAEKYSKDPSAKNNRGDIGAIGHDSPFVKEFKDAAFSGAKGDLIGPVKTMYGYHILKIVDKKPGKALNYDEVELQVKGELLQQMREDYVGRLKHEAKIQIDDKALEKL